MLYSPFKGVQTRATYRRDADDTYSIEGDEKNLIGERRTYEFTYGVNLNRDITPHASLNLKFSQTRKRGDQVSEFDRQFYTILAALEYQPFKKGRRKR